MGEATSKVRPHNSLLEEDLEFERLTKAVPVITEEVVQGLEERIKARILEGRWDDVVRLRPADEKPFLPSRFLELQDSKSSQSLAQIYEGEYTAAQEGGLVGDDRDGKLKKEHDELEKLWDGICGKLDALCNAHYTPKQVGLSSLISFLSTVMLNKLFYSPRLRYRLFPTSQPQVSNLHYPPVNLHPRCLLQKKSSPPRLQIFVPAVN